jgi:hypothetical protein
MPIGRANIWGSKGLRCRSCEGNAMPETDYFTEQVLRKRPYLTLEMCLSVLANPLRSEFKAMAVIALGDMWS